MKNEYSNGAWRMMEEPAIWCVIAALCHSILFCVIASAVALRSVHVIAFGRSTSKTIWIRWTAEQMACTTPMPFLFNFHCSHRCWGLRRKLSQWVGWERPKCGAQVNYYYFSSISLVFFCPLPVGDDRLRVARVDTVHSLCTQFNRNCLAALFCCLFAWMDMCECTTADT